MKSKAYILSKRFGVWALAFLPFLLQFKNVFNGKIIKGGFKYYKDWNKYSSLSKKGAFKLSILSSYPIFTDSNDEAGVMPTHYFLQDLWAARKVYDSQIDMHFDIGSRLDGFIAHCLSFTKVTMLDIRPLKISLDGLNFIQTDCTNMKNIQSCSLKSISSLHALEHFGLGRYGDPVDPFAHIKAINEIQRVSAPGANIYISVPIGIERLEFNAQRVFDATNFSKYFGECSLIEFSYIDDEEKFNQNTSLDVSSNIYYGCGLFHFKKIAN
jgi:hypothetical protein